MNVIVMAVAPSLRVTFSRSGGGGPGRGPAALHSLEVLPALSRQIGAERFDPASIRDGNIARPSIRSTESDIGTLPAPERDFYQNLSRRGDLRHRPLAVAGDIEVTRRITAHPIHNEVGELDEEPLVADLAP